jgi:hypothetical protein
MFSWLLGYKQEDDKKEEDAKKIEDNDDLSDIPPPPELKREQGYYEGNLNDVIRWKSYDEDIKQIREELEKIKLDSDKKWEARLSPVMETRKKKRRKRSTSASNGIKK